MSATIAMTKPTKLKDKALLQSACKLLGYNLKEGENGELKLTGKTTAYRNNTEIKFTRVSKKEVYLFNFNAENDKKVEIQVNGEPDGNMSADQLLNRITAAYVGEELKTSMRLRGLNMTSQVVNRKIGQIELTATSSASY